MTKLWNKPKPIQIFNDNIIKTDTCWFWIGACSKGYGVICYNYTYIYAHRFSYELVHGKISEDLELDHLCEIRNCVNPAHLEAVTHKINSQRAYFRPKDKLIDQLLDKKES